MSQNIKKSYRDKLLASAIDKGREFTTKDGLKLFFKYPTRGTKRDIIARATVDGVIDGALLETWATISLTQIAETKEQLFDESDADSIDGLLVGSAFEEVCSQALATLLQVTDNDPK